MLIVLVRKGEAIVKAQEIIPILLEDDNFKVYFAAKKLEKILAIAEF
ncbi:MAG: hypothetical protein ABIF12_01190 [bacterium]